MKEEHFSTNERWTNEMGQKKKTRWNLIQYFKKRKSQWRKNTFQQMNTSRPKKMLGLIYLFWFRFSFIFWCDSPFSEKWFIDWWEQVSFHSFAERIGSDSSDQTQSESEPHLKHPKGPDESVLTSTLSTKRSTKLCGPIRWKAFTQAIVSVTISNHGKSTF